MHACGWDVLTYAQAREHFREGAGSRVRLANPDTFLVRAGDDFGVEYLGAVIVRIQEDGTYTLDVGGWHTTGTASRINQYAPVVCWVEGSTVVCVPKLPGDRTGQENALDVSLRVDARGRPLR